MPRSLFAVLYRTAFAIAAFTAMFVSGAHASSEKVLYAFTGGNDGQLPYSNLIFDGSGNLYGTTNYGGANSKGTAFVLSPNGHGGWTETVIHTFGAGTDGYQPECGLLLDSSGNLYGTTYQGGKFGHGTVFELSPSGKNWKEKILHSFKGPEGADPIAGLILDSLGNLYGTASEGGSHEYGAVFMLTPGSNGQWKEKAIHSFNNNGHDGYAPLGALLLDSLGNLYGTTSQGGSQRNGIVFELVPGTNGKWTEKTIHTFNPANGHDGSAPNDALIMDASGNLYGTTYSGGKSKFYGTVFELSPATNGKWTETILHGFSGANDGSEPTAGVIMDGNGNLYGSTVVGGTAGVVYELSLVNGKWKETVLHEFKGGSDGDRAYGTLVFDTNGVLYGTTGHGGGNADAGTVFQVTP